MCVCVYVYEGFVWDYAVVSTGYLDFLPGYDNQFGVLRTVRLMRPLRAIGAIKGLRQQVEVLMMRETLENIGNVCLLMGITFSVFAIISVRFFGGVLRGHCYDAVTLELRDEEEICRAPDIGDPLGMSCATQKFDLDAP
eukprot:COSAG05_NODE_2340_length_3209_cov_18.437727_5_plen_139_part_00